MRRDTCGSAVGIHCVVLLATQCLEHPVVTCVASECGLQEEVQMRAFE
jgi:hypothetical protein